MTAHLLTEAIELLEKANTDLEPDLVGIGHARELLDLYARIEKLGSFGRVALARKVDSPTEIARVTGTSIGKAKEAVATAHILDRADELNDALRLGEISLDQAHEIARAEESSPGASRALLDSARTDPFHVLRDKARAVKLEAEQHRDLATRQHEARSARSYCDPLGMIHVHLAFEPHIGAPIVSRAEAGAGRLARAAKKAGDGEPFERHLADAYAEALMGGGSKSSRRRPELVVLVSHEVARRGWTDVRDGEVCKIPGIGPVAPKIAREIGDDAFLNGVFFDGTDLRQFKRWSRHIPVEVEIALELGSPPDFDGVKCVDCGNRHWTQLDHVEPRAARGPTSHPNLQPRCWDCHRAKTERDRKAGKLTPEPP